MMNQEIPVITIDGPSASGKGTIAMALAQELSFHYLDSGFLYRLVAYSVCAHHVPLNKKAIALHLCSVNITYQNGLYCLDHLDVSGHIRTPKIDELSSFVASIEEVRHFLLPYQKRARVAPGLVTDGRDMGTIIFPDAPLKVFLTASLAVRAQRRYEQLEKKHPSLDKGKVTEDIQKRDDRDRTRSCAPCIQDPSAFLVDTSGMDIREVVEIITQKWYSSVKV